jgi:hypothetical protein
VDRNKTPAKILRERDELRFWNSVTRQCASCNSRRHSNGHRTKALLLPSKRHDRTTNDPDARLGVASCGGSISVAVVNLPVQLSLKPQPSTTRAALRGIGNAADYSDGKEVDAERGALIPRDFVGRLLLPDEAQRLRLLSPDEAFPQPSGGDRVGNGHSSVLGGI